jgi:hypothetical protein
MAFIVSVAAPIITQPVISVTNVTPTTAQINLIAAATGAAPLTYFLTATANPLAPLPSSVTYNVSAFPYTVTALTPSTVYAFTLQAIDIAVNVYRSAPSLLQQITTGSGSLAITTASPLPGATVGKAYGSVVGASGGTSPYTWSITADTPDTGSWLSISSGTGVLSGVPSTVETESVTIKVVDAASNTASSTLSLPVTATTSTLLSFIKTLPAGGLISGQTLNWYNTGAGQWTDVFTGSSPNWTVGSTGRMVCVVNTQLMSAPVSQGWHSPTIATINAFIAKGGIFQGTLGPDNPAGSGTSGPSGGNGDGGADTGDNPIAVLTNGNAVQNKFYAYIDWFYTNVASQIVGPWILAPFGEMNGSGQWWNLRSANGPVYFTTAQFKQLWSLLYNRLVVYHGLKNVLFMLECGTVYLPYSTQSLLITNAFPTGQCDLISMDANSFSQMYSTDLQETYNVMNAVGVPMYGGASVGYNNAGGSNNYTQVAEVITGSQGCGADGGLVSMPNWIAAVYFCQGSSLQANSGALQCLSSPWLALSQLPNYLATCPAGGVAGG